MNPMYDTIRGISPLFLGVALITAPAWVWVLRPVIPLDVRVVDYTVPFDNYREHRGFIWLLNHHKVREESRTNLWSSTTDYIGYRPTSRQNPERLHQADLSRVDLVYVADTYGVYRDDLLFPEEQRAHMDYNPLQFGGLTVEDAEALSQLMDDGGGVLAEFNSFAAPTGTHAREVMEDALGLTWTGWVGRVFVDPYDPLDVPHWLPREFALQHPDRDLPTTPIFALVSHSGQIEVFSTPELFDAAPLIRMTEAGRQKFPKCRSGAPYFYWMSFMVPDTATTIYAEWALPDIDGLHDFVQTIGLSTHPPSFTRGDLERSGHRYYLSGDFADIDFDPGSHRTAGVMPVRSLLSTRLARPTQSPVFWTFYTPAVTAIFKDLAAQDRDDRAFVALK